MLRLIDDRYLSNGSDLVLDLATGHVVPSPAVIGSDGKDDPPIDSLVDVLDHGRDGCPRWVVADLRASRAVGGAVRRAAADASRRGYVPVTVDLFARRDTALAEALQDRALLLIATPTTPLPRARAALVAAAEACPRPHVLLTFRLEPPRAGGGTVPTRAAVVREARAAYGGMALPRRRNAVVPADVARLLSRAARAQEFLDLGRHAAAERLLRDVAGALRRRDASDAEARVLIDLGALLLQRGRVAPADRQFADAADAAARAHDHGLAMEARIGQTLARVEARQLSEAESLCRALLVAETVSPLQKAIVQATLARVLMAQGRHDEAAELDLELPADLVPDGHTALVDDTAVALLVARGDLFAAGQRARAALARSREPGVAHATARRAHLRVMAATGDATVTDEAFGAAVGAAKRARSPLDVLRAYLVWMDALRCGGRTGDLARAGRALERMRRVAPPLLRTWIDDRLRDRARVPSRSVPVSSPSDAAHALVQVCHERDDDRDAVGAALAWVAGRARAIRIDLWSCDAGPAAAMLTVGAGLPTTLGARVLEAGIPVGPSSEGGAELGVPVRLGPALIAALVARWPADRTVSSHAAPLLELAAAVAAPRIERIQAASREQARAATLVPELIGISDAMSGVRKAVARAAGAPFAVLIEGESGAGKELVARAIHQLSPRRERRFCDLNCAALPDDLLDAELFGHARGAFTGAVADRAGLFEEADGGTLFLDELADLSPRAQAKLLRVIQEQEVRRVGEAFDRKVDVRIVTAVNRDMHEEVAAGRFRQDLLYRLDVIRIRIPPLRERPADISVLAAHFWAQAAARVGTTATLTHGVLAALSAYPWPGNVRELQNVLSALAVAAPARGRVQVSLLPPALAGAAPSIPSALAAARAQFERRFIEAALARAGGRRAAAARDLGLSRQGLLKLMARLGISGTVERYRSTSAV